MEMAQYLDRLLLRYSGTFDIYKPYFIDGKEYPAYGYFFSHLEKYVLVREANLWASDSYEHILFITADKITEEHVKEPQDVIQNYMEPKLVRKGARVPEKDHMYSFLTVILLSQYPPDRNTLKSVKRYSFDKGYRFNLRGFSTGHMALVSMEDRKITCNRAAAKKVKLLKEIFEEVDAGKPGFDELCEKKDVKPFSQKGRTGDGEREPEDGAKQGL